VPKRTRKKFKNGDRVVAQVYLLKNPKTLSPATGTIEGDGRWEADHHPCWYFGVDLDGPGGVLNCQCKLQPADVVTKLGDVVRGV